MPTMEMPVRCVLLIRITTKLMPMHVSIVHLVQLLRDSQDRKQTLLVVCFFIDATFQEFSLLHFFKSEKEDKILYYLRILLFLQNI